VSSGDALLGGAMGGAGLDDDDGDANVEQPNDLPPLD